MKFNANDFLNSLNMELSIKEMHEVNKALVAYTLGIEEITPEINKKLDTVIDFYYDASHIRFFLNEEVIDFAQDILKGDE